MVIRCRDLAWVSIRLQMKKWKQTIQAALDDGYRAFDTHIFIIMKKHSVKALKIVECLEKTCLLQLNYGTTIKVMIVRLSILIAH